jgi:hypothetical protein
MKYFRKSENGFFICEECGKEVINNQSLSHHINLNHMKFKIYYDKWIREKEDGKCKTCGKETALNRTKYRIFCSSKCMANNKELTLIKRKTKNEKYGNENYVNPNKAKKTKKEKYGNENYHNIEKIKETKLKKFGNKNFNNREKAKKTCLEKYGVEIPLQNKDIYIKARNTLLQKSGYKYPLSSENAKTKFKKTCLDRYGFEYPAQNFKIFAKSQKVLLKKFRDTNLWYQGSYEFDFLEKYYNKFSSIEKSPIIRYFFEGKNKIYHPDFYIPSLNLIIEIKNSYLLKRDKNIIEAKEKATISNGFNYIMILDKNYNEIEKLYFS